MSSREIDLYNIEELTATLGGLGYKFYYTPETTSTMDLAREAGTTPTVVITDTQYRGRGRMGRSWFDQPCMSILMTIAEPFSQAEGDPELFSPIPQKIAALAACMALEKQTNTPIKIKWPNDLVSAHNGRKVGGILLETPDYKEHETYPLLIGVGINVHYKQMEGLVFSDYGVVSLAEIVSEDIRLSRADLVLAMMRKWAEFRPALRDMSDPEVFSYYEELWKQYSMLLGRRIEVNGVENDPDKTIEGIVTNTPLNEGLIVVTESGVESIKTFNTNTRIQIVK